MDAETWKAWLPVIQGIGVTLFGGIVSLYAVYLRNKKDGKSSSYLFKSEMAYRSAVNRKFSAILKLYMDCEAAREEQDKQIAHLREELRKWIRKTREEDEDE